MEKKLTPEQIAELKEKIKNMSPEELREFQKKQCIFCQINEGRVSSKRVYDDDICTAILDINPSNPGHILLMPKEHYTILPQVPPDIIRHLAVVAKKLSNAALRALDAKGTNILIANGIAAGQKAQHLMLHIIPRKEKDSVSFSIPQKEQPIDQLDEVQRKLAERLGGVVEIGRHQKAERREVEAEIKEERAEKWKNNQGKSKGAGERKSKQNGESLDLDAIASLFSGGKK